MSAVATRTDHDQQVLPCSSNMICTVGYLVNLQLLPLYMINGTCTIKIDRCRDTSILEI